MADTNFVPGTIVTSEWLNDVNAITYGLGSTAPGKGAKMVAFKKLGITSAVETTVDELMQQAPLTPAMFSGDLQAMFTAAMANSLPVYLPASDYTLTAKITASGPRAISVFGDGPANTRLFWTSEDSGIELSVSDAALCGQFTVNGIGFYADNVTGNCTGPALKIQATAPQGGTPYAGGVIDNVVVDTHPDKPKTPRGWANGIHIKNIGGFDFGAVFLYGPSVGYEGNGITLEGDCTPGSNLVDVKCYKWDKALANTGAATDTTEGITVGPGCLFVNNNYGVYLDFSLSGGEPGFQLDGAHLNNNIRNVYVKDADQISVRDALMYKRPNSSSDFTHIEVVSCFTSSITNNFFVGAGAGGVNKCVVLEQVNNAHVFGNILQTEAGYAVGLEIKSSTSQDVRYALNDFEHAVSPVVNEITDVLRFTGAGHQAIDGSVFLLSLDGDGQSIPNATNTTVTDWFVRVDSQAATHSAGAITIGKGVRRVRFSMQLLFDLNATGRREVTMTKNGTSFFGQPRVTADAVSSAATSIHAQSAEVDVVEGDVFRVVVYQNSGGALNISSTVSSWVSMQVIA